MSLTDKLRYSKLLEDLEKHKFREYKISSFKELKLRDKDWGKSKRSRIIHKGYIHVYSTYQKRLLRRTFYFEQGYRKKERYEYMDEVCRTLAGLEVKIIKNLKLSVFGRIRYKQLSNEWERCNLNTVNLAYSRYYYECAIYNHNNYLQYLSKTIHKYSAYELLSDKKWDIFEYLKRYEKHPQIEMLVKLHLEHILYGEYKYIRWSKKGYDMLSIRKEDVPFLQSGISLNDFKKHKDQIHKDKLTPLESKMFIKITEIKELQYSKKLVQYLMNCGCTFYSCCITYVDYIRFMETLGIPKENKYLYPKNLDKAHDELFDKIEIARINKYDEKIKKRYIELKKYIYSNGRFSIIPAESVESLIKESNELHHCVRNYAEFIAEGTSQIYYIRRNNEMDKPFYTLEVQNKVVSQVHGSRNSLPVPEIIEFISEWTRKNHIKY